MGIAGPQTWKPGVHALLPMRAAVLPYNRRKFQFKAHNGPVLEGKEQEGAVTPQTNRDAEKLEVSSKEEQAPNDPRDQRPFIVKIIMSMATAIWSSFGRLFANFPANFGHLFNRLLVPLIAMSCYSVRFLEDEYSCKLQSMVISLTCVF
jgi:hypothetical protein